MCYVYSVGVFLFKLCVLSIQHVGMNICSFKCALGKTSLYRIIIQPEAQHVHNSIIIKKYLFIYLFLQPVALKGSFGHTKYMQLTK